MSDGALNLLEQALSKVVRHQQGALMPFYRLLLAARVWLPAVDKKDDDGAGSVRLQHWQRQDGSQVIPFFSSQRALCQAAGEKAPFTVMAVRTLFEMTQGETLFLNAQLPESKEFSPAEIRYLLDEQESLLQPQQVIQGGGSLLLSVLEPPPAQVITPLITLFDELKTVKRAFICGVKEQAEQQSRLLIGIETDSDFAAMVQQIGNVASEGLAEDETVDICQLKEGGEDTAISHLIMAHIPPFYQHRWGSFLRDYQRRII